MTARLSSRTAAVVRRSVNAMLTERCTIERETGGTGLYGEPVHAWEVAAENVPCRLITVGRRNSGETQGIGSRESVVDAFRLICPHDTAFAVDNRVKIDDRRYAVVTVEDDPTDAAFVTAILVRERG